MARYQELECSEHGLTIHRKRAGRTKSWVCKECQKKWSHERQLKNKLKLIKYLGGECIHCGYDNHIAMCFHHTDPEDKCFTISNRRYLSYDKLFEEAKKCVLLCANCHILEHYRLNGA